MPVVPAGAPAGTCATQNGDAKMQTNNKRVALFMSPPMMRIFPGGILLQRAGGKCRRSPDNELEAQATALQEVAHATASCRQYLPFARTRKSPVGNRGFLFARCSPG